MWTCPACGQQFKNTGQAHSCGDRTLDDFLKGKSEETIKLFWLFVDSYRKVGNISLHPTKSMIGIAATTRIAYVTRLGKNFVDIVFPFEKPFQGSLCFHRVAQVPGSQQFNHHLRLMEPDDINQEVRKYMALAYEGGK